MDPWCCVPVLASRGASGVSVHRPGCLALKLEQVPGGRTDSGTVRSGGLGFRSPARPPRCAASSERTSWRRRPEREVGMRAQRKLGASPPVSLPRLAGTRTPLASGSARGRLPPPRVGSAGAERALQARPSYWGGCQGPGAGGARGQETVTPENSISSTWPWLPRCAPEFAPTGLRAECFPPPQADQRQGSPANGAGPLPETPPFRGAEAALESHLPGSAPSSPQPCPAERRGGQKSAPGSALPGRPAPTLQQVELSGCQRQRLHPVPRLPDARGRPQR